MSARQDWSAVLFDLDGTLADTVELILRCFRHTMVTHRGEAPPDAVWLATLGKPLRVQLAALATDDDEADRMVETYVARQLELHDGLVRPYPGIPEAVAGLEGRDVPLAVVTSKRHRMARRTLACCGLDAAIPLLIGADDVRNGKPDPEPVLLALERLGIDRPEDVVFVGDSPWDIQAGRAAGTRTAAVLWGPYEAAVLESERPDYMLERPAELLTLPRRP